MDIKTDRYTLLLGECLARLKELPDDSIDSMATDPPGALRLMGKKAKWDDFHKRQALEGPPFPTTGLAPLKTDRDPFIEDMTKIFAECYRVLKPGSFSLVWGLPRTVHWTAIALEEAGFEVADKICHLQAQGFVKSMNIAKAMQKADGVKPIGEKPASLGFANNPMWNDLNRQLVMPELDENYKAWEGLGTALKPVREDYILVQKPFSTTYVENIRKWGTGALNLDACRIGKNAGWSYPNGKGGSPCLEGGFKDIPCEATKGRVPTNTIFSHAEECVLVGEAQVKTGKAFRENGGGKNCLTDVDKPPMENMTYGNEDGLETVEFWACVPTCPVRILDAQSGKLKSGKGAVKRKSAKGGKQSNSMGAESRAEGTPMKCYGDEGFASRFYFVAKPAKKEKEAGCGNLPTKTAAEVTGRKEGSAGLLMPTADGGVRANPYAGNSGAVPKTNIHPCVKSVSLFRYLCRLITPTGGTVLDPFLGSGSTGVACMEEGFRFIGIERENTEEMPYFAIAAARISHAHALNSLETTELK